MDQAMRPEHLTETNEAIIEGQLAALDDCLVLLARLLRVACEMPFVIGRWSRTAYPRGRCRRR